MAAANDLGSRLAEIKGAQVIKSFCYTCPWQCPTEVFVRDNKLSITKGILNPLTISGPGAQKGWRFGM